jgi:hypothetical protein
MISSREKDYYQRIDLDGDSTWQPRIILYLESATRQANMGSHATARDYNNNRGLQYGTCPS